MASYSLGHQEFKTQHFWKGVFAELLGTTLYVFISCGSTLAWPNHKQPETLDISLAFGFSLATVIQCIGCISGGHVNPAITVAFLLTGKISLIKALFYIIMQASGAIAGAAMLYGVTPPAARGNLGMTLLGDDVSIWQAVSVEIILTFFMVLTVFSTLDPGRQQSGFGVPLSIGVAVTACHIVGIKYTGCSINPARSFGPAVIKNTFKDQWIFWAGPILAGVFAGVVYELLFRVHETNSDQSSIFSPLRICNINCCQITCSDTPKQPTDFVEHYRQQTGESGTQDYDDVIELRLSTDTLSKLSAK